MAATGATIGAYGGHLGACLGSIGGHLGTSRLRILRHILAARATFPPRHHLLRYIVAMLAFSRIAPWLLRATFSNLDGHLGARSMAPCYLLTLLGDCPNINLLVN